MALGDLWCERGGATGPTMVLLHGLGANGEVWNGIKAHVAEHWKGQWVIPDLRGHGRSPHRAPYTFESYAADVAALVPPGNEATVVGHSMGGLIALLLASGQFDVVVENVVASSVKVDWTEDEFARGRAIADTPAKIFGTKEEAVERYLRVSGLKDLIKADSTAATVGVREDGGKFRLSADPWTNAVAPVDFIRLVRDARTPVTLLCGDQDQIATAASMHRLGRQVTVLPGLGHNLHVEAPDAFWAAIAPTVLGR